MENEVGVLAIHLRRYREKFTNKKNLVDTRYQNEINVIIVQ